MGSCKSVSHKKPGGKNHTTNLSWKNILGIKVGIYCVKLIFAFWVIILYYCLAIR